MSLPQTHGLELYTQVRKLLDSNQAAKAHQLVKDVPNEIRSDPFYLLSFVETTILSNRIGKLYLYLEKTAAFNLDHLEKENYIYWPTNLLANLLIAENRMSEARTLLDSIAPYTHKFSHSVYNHLSLIYNANHNELIADEIHKSELGLSSDYTFNIWTLTPEVLSLVYDTIFSSEKMNM
jgi:hypothetical protein